MDSLLKSISLPQDPFLPQTTPLGPSFLDTQACLCALQPITTDDNAPLAWQCIGNQTDGIYTSSKGKWFNPKNGGTAADANLTMEDDSNPPDLSQALVFDSSSDSLQPMGQSDSGLSVYDNACTGVNRTQFSTSFYRTEHELENGETPVDATLCWLPGAISVQIQNASSWESLGCLAGFWCPNNTMNSLPQYCPPITICQEKRLSGGVCPFPQDGVNLNIPMGPFEPVICDSGYYCPPPGTDRIKCPKGSYCQPGTASPTPCTVGASCPEGSYYQTFAIPLAVLIIVDAFLALGIFYHTIRRRFHRKKASSNSKLKGLGALSSMKQQVTGYKALPEETEMLPMEATFVPRQHEPAGFQAMLGMDFDSGDDSEKLDGQMSGHLRQFVESMRKATDAAHFGLSFEFQDLTFHPKKCPKPILSNITGMIDRGSLTAVMGGSGAGKSTFVNVLMGKTINTNGVVMVNGMVDKIRNYKKIIGYVPQDDIVIAELTVYENILHSARIRLPRTWSDADIKSHVNAVIDCLELSHVRDSLVGSVGKPTISGGQRKRVSIGMELAAAPMAVFLDEPTSGLDATSASSLMSTLKAVAKIGISVIVIIHQPRMEIFEIIDDLILLANGQLIYQGPESEVQPFFEGIEFEFPEHSNFGDVVTDIITGNGRAYKKAGDVSKDALIGWWAQHAAAKKIDQKKPKHTSTMVGTGPNMRQMLKTRGAPRMKQFILCLKRAMLQQYRLKTVFWFEMGLAFLGGFLIGLAENGNHGVNFVGIYNHPYEEISIAINYHDVPEMALLTAIGIGLIAGSPGVKVFSEETLVQRREAEAGHSQVAYFFAKNLSAVPRMLLGCMHFTIPLLFLSSTIMPWALAFAANLLYFYSIYGLASVVSMVAKREDAPLFATMLSLITGILSGAAPPLRKVRQWHMAWLWRASPGVWIAELYFGQMVGPLRPIYNVDMAAMASGFELHWMVIDLAALVAIGTVYRVIAFVGLYFGKRLRI